MGRRSRDKGARIELEIVRRHVELDIPAQRVPLSGAAGGRFSGDVHVYLHGEGEPPLVTEVKARAGGQGFAQLERWIGDKDILFLRRDRALPMVILPWRTYSRLVDRR